MPSAENCTACRFHQEIDQGTQNALAFCPPKVSDAVSLTAYLLYQTVFHLSRTFFKTFFEVFEAILSKLKLFLTAVSFETAYLLYQTETRLSRTFFVLFKPFFSSTAAPLSDSFNRIPQRESGVNNNFQFFSYFLKLVVFCFLCYNKYRTLRTKPQRCLYLP